jgi:hypothetical protein
VITGSGGISMTADSSGSHDLPDYYHDENTETYWKRRANESIAEAIGPPMLKADFNGNHLAFEEYTKNRKNIRRRISRAKAAALKKKDLVDGTRGIVRTLKL